jgi:predicted RNase H-like nuclease (RuvC/YqgF family)
MTKLKNPSHTNEESVEAMSDDEIYDKVISTIVGPPRSGYIRGLGAGPKPKKSKVAANSHSQVQEARRRADEAERRSTQLADELEAVKASAAQQNEELEAVKVSAAQQSEELKAVKAKQNETDALLKKLMAQLTSRK